MLKKFNYYDLKTQQFEKIVVFFIMTFIDLVIIKCYYDYIKISHNKEGLTYEK